VIGNGYRRHVHFFYALNELLDVREAVQQRILRMDMQMSKCHETIKGVWIFGAESGGTK